MIDYARCGSGRAAGFEPADGVVVRDELAALPQVVALSRQARRVAAAIIVSLATWDLVGHLPLPLGVAGHEGSTVLVGLNGLRLLRAKVWERAAAAPARRPAELPHLTAVAERSGVGR